MSLRVSEVHTRTRQRPWALGLAAALFVLQAGLTIAHSLGDDTDNRFARRMFSSYGDSCAVNLQAFGGPKPIEVTLQDPARTGKGPIERFRKKWCTTLSARGYVQVLVNVCDDAPPYLQELSIRPYFCEQFR